MAIMSRKPARWWSGCTGQEAATSEAAAAQLDRLLARANHRRARQLRQSRRQRVVHNWLRFFAALFRFTAPAVTAISLAVLLIGSMVLLFRLAPATVPVEVARHHIPGEVPVRVGPVPLPTREPDTIRLAPARSAAYNGVLSVPASPLSRSEMRASVVPVAWVVDTTGAPVWAGPGSRYAQMATLPPGEQVTVIGVLDDWLLVKYAAQDEEGWIVRERLDLSPAVAGVAPVPVSDIPPLPVLTAAVKAEGVGLQIGPGDRYETDATLVAGQSVELLAFHRAHHDDVWLHVRTSEQVGWLPVAALTFADGTLLRVPMAATIPDPPPFVPTEQAARSPQVQTQPAAPAPRANNQHIADYARTFIGRPYIWAAAGPDAFDCSGLVVYVYRQYGVHLPHNAAVQAQGNYGVPVAIDDLAPGDLVFFRDTYMPGISHVAIYYRDGWMVNAESPATGVRWSHIHESYWWYRFAGARRITTGN